MKYIWTDEWSTFDDPYIKLEWISLPVEHREALARFIDKFFKGYKEHGDFKKGKDWTPDRIDEQADYAFYTIFELLDYERQRRKSD